MDMVCDEDPSLVNLSDMAVKDVRKAVAGRYEALEDPLYDLPITALIQRTICLMDLEQRCTAAWRDLLQPDHKP
ncbi:hypothetical protein BV898_01847 [Hypsibius exemplaris]|uniref:Uncharacterized protein n=1 Tax=Hypsibius exemplaris TaxID=2072580 RepID=A0A1W0XA75_HYPEX|nr:hypothetical protein BV898_01847 [Hypsibius exemplaris]